eukprot:881171-Pleurochrysis_carterae.AAC.1
MLFDAPRYVSLLRVRALKPVEQTGSPVPARMSKPTRHVRVSAPIATPARVLIATRPRRNSPRHNRPLRDGARSVGFVVDSG